MAQTLPKTRPTSCFAPDGPGEERPQVSPRQPELGCKGDRCCRDPPAPHWSTLSGEHPDQCPPHGTRGCPGHVVGAGKGVQGPGGQRLPLPCSPAALPRWEPLCFKASLKAVGSREGDKPCARRGDRDRGTRAPSFAPACAKGGRKDGEFMKQRQAQPCTQESGMLLFTASSFL